MQIETVRVSSTGKNQLMTLKRRTGIPTWNILCRWAFCVSLAEKTKPHGLRQESEFPIEMTWKTFAGEYEGIYLALLKKRCLDDGLELTLEELHQQLKLHVHRGIAYLAGDKQMRCIEDLVAKSSIME